MREDAEFKSILMLGLSAMALFFSFGFFLPAVLAEPGFLVVSVVLFVIGIALIIASRVVKHRMRKQIARLTDELHVKCDYCGGVNDRDQHRCAFCGAPIVTLPHKGSSAGPTFR
ncbi:MAG: hypothetical protein ISF22_03205 [Methanomassiliicoccus sp.]|nr:hypothetical protein [Methanomassiliicoccus sp.]